MISLSDPRLIKALHDPDPQVMADRMEQVGRTLRTLRDDEKLTESIQREADSKLAIIDARRKLIQESCDHPVTESHTGVDDSYTNL